MNIYLEPSGYRLLNVGDAAMQMIAAERLADFWSPATLSATTEDVRKLAYFCPSVVPVSAASRRSFFSDKLLGERLHKSLPDVVSKQVKNLAPLVRRRFPNFVNLVANRRKSAKNDEASADFWTTLKNSDLVVVSGAGSMTDAFETHARTILETLDLASELKIPAVMFGQGIGPIKNSGLLEAARRVLPKVDLICLRESRKGVELLKDFGVSTGKICVTGDDAIETAYNARKKSIGNLIGVNVRVADYSKVEVSEAAAIAETLRKIAGRYQTELLPVPISFQSGERSDIHVLQSIAAAKNVDYTSDESKTPAFVIRQISHCRIVITGSYHAAVFSLAQGIPVVCVAKSEYYLDKFYGVAEQFQVGCRVVSWQSGFDPAALTEAVENAWNEAEAVKEPLLEQARKQIAQGRAAYQKLYELMAARKSPVNRRSFNVAEQT